MQDYLDTLGVSMPCYLSVISNVGSAIDGLFLWCLSCAKNMHINIVHAAGIWTTCHCTNLDLQDPVVVLTLGPILAATAIGVMKDDKGAHNKVTSETVSALPVP